MKHNDEHTYFIGDEEVINLSGNISFPSSNVYFALLQKQGAPIDGKISFHIRHGWIIKCLRDHKRRGFIYIFIDQTNKPPEAEKEIQVEGITGAGMGEQVKVRPPNEKKQAFDALVADAEKRRAQSQLPDANMIVEKGEVITKRKWTSLLASFIITLIMVFGTLELISYIVDFVIFLRGVGHVAMEALRATGL